MARSRSNNIILQINKIFKDGVGIGGFFHSVVQICIQVMDGRRITASPRSCNGRRVEAKKRQCGGVDWRLNIMRCVLSIF
ncbi:hypothetical protein QVD17_00663 [Tagetes erecta]|uniref:Uncharacterized protein n=1 Tax=Tagetes erecta TaxID=13708 RepID=A0AAD8L5I8_TARER|nr:hypothetical protein QVD17_00663 [Tagetes erecta]